MPFFSKMKMLLNAFINFCRFHRRHGGLLILLLLSLALLMPDRQPPPTHLEQILSRGELRVATRVGPLIYYERDELPAGLDYFLLEELAQHLGVRLEIDVQDEIPALLNQVLIDEADIASANLTITPARSALFDFSIPYLEVTSVLIQHSQEPPVRSLEQITPDHTLVVIAGSSHAELLQELRLEHRNLHWAEEPNTIMFELMERVQNREIDFAIIDSSIFELERPYFPRVEVAIELGEPQPLAWALKPDRDKDFLTEVNRFLRNYRASGELDELVAGVYSHNEPFNVAGSLTLLERIEDRLPQFEPLFRQVASEVDMDWIMLAAVSYQESHWNPRARSPTGVRGLMMLTLPTARQLGVDNRLDAEQSLRAGAQYLLNLHTRLPERIVEPDRMKLALAAYNVGYGHMEDARILTERSGDNPDIWDDVKRYLPLLQRREYFETLRFGYARGTEAVTYVDNIYHFYNILESHAWMQERETMREFFQQPLPEIEVEEPFPAFRDILDMPLSPI